MTPRPYPKRLSEPRASSWLAAWLLSTALLVQAGCSNVPENIRKPADAQIGVDEARGDWPRFRGSEVRWGGELVSLTNLAEVTELEMVSRPLDTHGRPLRSDTSDGRFLVQIDGFLEPQSFTPGREVTVRGTLSDLHQGRIGEFPYDYPVVTASAYHLWPKAEPVSRHPYDYDPFWYDPFWSPYAHPWWWHPRHRYWW